MEKRREEEKRLAEERRTRELQEEASRQQMEAEMKAKEQEERQRRKREQQEADRKRLDELEAKRRIRDTKEQKAKKDLKIDSRNDKIYNKAFVEEKEHSATDRRDGKKSSSNTVSSSDLEDGRGRKHTEEGDAKETKYRDEKHRHSQKSTREREKENAKTHEEKKSEQQRPTQKRDPSTEREANDQKPNCSAPSTDEKKPEATVAGASATAGTDSGNSTKLEEKVASINPRLQELAKAMEVAVGPVGVTQERLLEMVLKTLVRTSLHLIHRDSQSLVLIILDAVSIATNLAFGNCVES